MYLMYFVNCNRDQQTSWHNLIWSSFNLPRHAFVSWLIFRRKLSTQDRIQAWFKASGSMNLMCCLLCQRGVESHIHLFFECAYSSRIWCSLRGKGGMNHIQGKWDDIAEWLIPEATSKSAKTVIAKLLLTAMAYYIWQERNVRFYKNQLRPPEKVEELIVETIRLKLHSFKFKKNDRVRRILEEWKITSVEVMEGE
ncbi:putative reverse transcriptase zinc-binding domain-containing protein [Helianthus annuus]|nr:putative reverse transcriptase zinc-binding domain-containing protein [Helianthus annuus]